MADLGISDIAVEYVDDPRVAEETEMLHKMMDDIERRMPKATDECREALAEALASATSRRAMLQDRAQRARFVLFHHGVRFELGDESEGTRLWLAVLPQVITSLGSGRTLVIAKIGTSLHPLLVRKLVGLFRDRTVNVRGTCAARN